jgi:type I restriction enzyme S subunit
MANRIVKIEDICHVVKGETGIMKAIPGEYPMVVLSEERKTHNEFQFDCKAVIIPLVSSTGHGHASMKRIHYQEGKFALGSILCALIPKNEGEYDPEYLYHILDMGKERIFVPLMKGMANVSLPMNRIKSVEINLPPYNEQVRLSKIYSEVTTNLDLLKNQTDKQHKYLKQLRQSILQLAVQGKLSAKWREENPNVEPASVLLENIKAENEKLIQEGKIKREKPQPKISENERPFELPESWEWCRLGEIAQSLIGLTYKPSDIATFGTPVLRSNNIQDSKLVLSNLVIVKSKVPLTKMAKKGDILICVRNGSKKLIGKVAIIDADNFSFGAFMSIIRTKLDSKYLFYFLLSNVFRNQIDDEKSTGINQLTQSVLNNIMFICPPIFEQQAIVQVVEQFLLLCDELEKKIEKRDSYQERIMQAVVKQAFTVKNQTINT